MLQEKFEELNNKLDQVLKIHKSLPEWYPITKIFADECGYRTVWGLTKWCRSNLSPDDFVKRGKFWFIHVRSLSHVKMKAS